MADDGPALPSRYLSQRRKDPLDQTKAHDLNHRSSQDEDTISRSKSRYRKRTGTSAGSPPQSSPPVPQLPSDLPTRYHTKHSNAPFQPAGQEQLVHDSTRQQDISTNEVRQSDLRQASPPVQSRASDPLLGDRAKDDSPAMNGRYRSTRTRREPAAPQASPSPPTVTQYEPGHYPQPSGELFPPVKPVEKPVRQDGPPQSGQIRATKSVSELPKYDDSDDGCLARFFKRKRGEASPVVEKAPIARPVNSRGELLPIRPGGGGIVPGTDAPVSAVNAGDRLVRVECGKSERVFPVTPTTTPTDIIKSASTCMSERIDVKSAILLEHFGTVGVQRPLRRYEHIRDIMNSWDMDKQNSLLLVDPATGSVEPELTLAGVPNQKPEDQSWYLFYSQKAGKWEKRYVTLKSDGQITCRKDEDSKVKDIQNVCHLSDFDVYTPTPERLRKKIKPPKKFCHAIKSQQKTIMFESTENFVHFFSTSDKATANSFYGAIQGWRSWYLVNVLEEGKKTKAPPAALATETNARHTSNDHAVKAHRQGESMDSHYQLGSFKPLIDAERFDKPAHNSAGEGFVKSSNQLDTNISPERRASTRRSNNPPIALNNKAILADDEPLANLARSGSLNRHSSINRHRVSDKRLQTAATTEFNDNSLLGRKYSQRRRDISGKEDEEPWTTGPNLLNGGLRDDDHTPRRQSSTRRHPTADINRSSSTRDRTIRERRTSNDMVRSHTRARHNQTQTQMPKPLIDLTPEYREAPQFSKKNLGKGYVPDGHTSGEIGGPLIESATSPEDVLGIPSSTDWRHRNANPGAYEVGGGGLQRGGSVRASGSKSRSPAGRETAFTGEGLLGAMGEGKQGWGGESKGRGVVVDERREGGLVEFSR
ncbi:unnamed protein product [Zymoseptoria tritici ST99CH_1E4]|uniref:PH domain-containing protein n=1 Tax=Zymoseptoria tritici ST99CH_1E4 TaxID=1276532 RepID=A0A2H1GUF8_ZYMTR|nr:unnamed protein product [Zymoseptoria tritici ST99CH_1E4]